MSADSILGVWRWAAGAAAVGAGIALRVWVYRSPTGAPDSDEAIVGLMARHVLHGEFTVFFWGQVYGGSQEAVLAAPFVAIFGGGLFALRLVPIALAAVAAVLVWRIGRRTMPKTAAVTAGLLLWVWPPYTIVHGTVAYGFYGTNLAYAALLLLLVLRAADEPSALRVGIAGLVLGLAFWQTAQVIPVAAPALAWLGMRRPSIWRRLWIGAVGAAIGALPWIVWNIGHGGASVLKRSDVASYLHGLRLFASPLFPMLLGLRTPLTGAALVPKIVLYVVYVSLLAAFAVYGIRSRRTSASLIVAVAAAFPLLWAFSHRVTILTSHPVYLIVLSPVVALLLARMATTELRAASLLVVCLAISVSTIHRMNGWLASDRPHWPPTTPRNLAPLVAALDRLRISHAYAEYWIAYRLAYDTDERIVASADDWEKWSTRNREVVPAERDRYHPYYVRVANARHAFVFFRRSIELTPVQGALRRAHYRRVIVGPFIVWAPPRPH